MDTTKRRWVRGEDAGHGAGAMLLDAPVGHWSVRRANGRRWVAALVKNGIAVWSREFPTRREAMEFAEADAAVHGTVNVSISICPTDMEFNDGSVYDEHALLDAIRAFVMQRHPTARITTLQVGHRQGDKWARVDGDSAEGRELLSAFFEAHGADESLFVATA